MRKKIAALALLATLALASGFAYTSTRADSGNECCYAGAECCENGGSACCVVHTDE